MSIHILGCGNVLKGDDGFGPAVSSYLEREYLIPDHISVLDGGLGCSEWLNPLIYDEDRPREIIVIDTMDMGLKPGTVKLLTVHDLDLMDLSMSSHFFPDKGMITQLIKLGVAFTFVTCQITEYPKDLNENLSEAVEKAIPEAAHLIATKVGLTWSPKQ